MTSNPPFSINFIAKFSEKNMKDFLPKRILSNQTPKNSFLLYHNFDL